MHGSWEMRCYLCEEHTDQLKASFYDFWHTFFFKSRCVRLI
jgi:hypothetical protein